MEEPNTSGPAAVRGGSRTFARHPLTGAPQLQIPAATPQASQTRHNIINNSISISANTNPIVNNNNNNQKELDNLKQHERKCNNHENPARRLVLTLRLHASINLREQQQQ